MPSSEVVEKIVQNRDRVVCVRSAATVTEASRKMRDHDVGSQVVMDDAGQVAGQGHMGNSEPTPIGSIPKTQLRVLAEVIHLFPANWDRL